MYPWSTRVPAGCGCVSVECSSPVLWLRETLDEVPGVEVGRDAHDLKHTVCFIKMESGAQNAREGQHVVVYGSSGG